MKKRLLAVLLSAVMVLGLVPFAVSAAEVATLETLQGKGTSANPYKISTLSDLSTLAAYVNAGNDCYGLYFSQTADITNALTTPIGGNGTTNAFCGYYDGNGHKVNVDFKLEANSGSIVAGSNTGVGLFAILGAYVSGAWRNATVRNVFVYGKCDAASCQYVGGVCGKLARGGIYDCVSEVDVIGFSSVGGIVGGINGTAGCIVKNCAVNFVSNQYITAKKASSGVNLGGIAGIVMNNNTVENCYAGQKVIAAAGTSYVGGVVGCDYNLIQTSPVAANEFKNCYALTIVSDATKMGYTKAVGNTDKGALVAASTPKLKEVIAVLNANKADFNKRWIPSAGSMPYPTLTFAADTTSASLNSMVALNFQIDLDWYKTFYKLGDGASVYAEFNQNAATYDKDLTSSEMVFNEETGKYGISVNANPAQIGDSVRVYVSETVGQTTTSYDIIASYSIKDYCEYQIFSSKDKYLVNCCKALLNYGAECQKQFNYKADTLVNAGKNYELDLIDIKETWSGYNNKYESAIAASNFANPEIFNPKDISFLALNKSTIRFYYDGLNGDYAEIKHPNATTGIITAYALDDSGEKDPTDPTTYDYYYTELANIAPISLGVEYNVTVNYKGVETTVNYSILQCVRDLVEVGATTQSFYDALCDYYIACNYYKF